MPLDLFSGQQVGPPGPAPCEHPPYSQSTKVVITCMGEVTENYTTRFISLTGGDLTLTAEMCRCHYLTYSLRERGKPAEAIGDDPKVVTAALLAVVSQRPSMCFALTAHADKHRSAIVPRHHLPLLVVEK